MAKGWSLGALVAAIKGAAFLDVGVVSNTVAAGDDSRFQTPGLVFMFAGTSAPVGSLKCNGALVSRTTYARLFSVIGTYYGPGDGSTTFQLPDLRGEFIRGWDDWRGVDSGRTLGSAQASTGLRTAALDYYGVDGTTSNGTVGTAFNQPDSLTTIQPGDAKAPNNAVLGGDLGDNSTQAAQLQTGIQGGSVWITTRPRNVALLYCIKT